MTDAWMDELFKLSVTYRAHTVVARVSRLVCDVERHRDDAAEPMAAIGMGALYTCGSDGQQLRKLSEAVRERLLATYYDPHHARLTKLVDEALEASGCCLIIDVHSFRSRPLPYEFDRSTSRPEVCIGFDSVHGRFLDDGKWEKDCRRAGLVGQANRPFSGSIIPRKHLGNENVMSVMIGVRRDLYMDEATGEKMPSFGEMSRKLAILGVALACTASSYRDYLAKLRVPYCDRLPLPWAGEVAVPFERVAHLLGAEEEADAVSEARAYVEDVLAGRVVPHDRSEIPKTPEEAAHFMEYVRRSCLLTTLHNRICDDGETVEEFDWDGCGESTSPGSSFYASVSEWRGLYAWKSDVDFGGPFACLKEAVTSMRRHCGVRDDDAAD